MQGSPLRTLNIEKVISELIQNSKKDCIQTMNSIVTSMNSNNAPIYLAFIISFLSKKVDLPKDKFSELHLLLSQITNLLASFLPESFQNLIPSPDRLVLQEKTSKDKEKTNFMYESKQIILESLIKNSKHEIWNALNVFFKNKGYREFSVDEDTHKLFLDSLNNCDDVQRPQLIKEIAYLIEPKNVTKILQYFEEKPIFTEEFFLLLKFSNTVSYEYLIKTVYSEKKYFKETIIPYLPDLEFGKIVGYIKDYNWNVTASILEKRPEMALHIIEAFHNGELGMNRSFFIDVLASQDTIFSKFFEDLKLSTDEVNELTTKSFYFAKRQFLNIQSEDQMLGFCKNFTKKFENRLFDFIKEIEESNLFELFLKCLLRTFRLTGELKSYILSKYSTNQRFFHGLIPYLSMETIEQYLEDFYQKDLSLECLLRKSNPQELIIDFHKFKNSELSSQILTECISNSKFEDNDWILAMKSLEQIESPVKMLMCKLILTEKPRLKNQVIIFIKRSMGEFIWMFRRNISDLINCLEILGEESISVYEAMTREEIIFVLRKSKILEENLRKYLSRFNYNNFTSNMRFLDECLRNV